MHPSLYQREITEIAEKVRTVSCFTKEGSKTIITMRYITNPHTEYFVIDIKDGKIIIDIESDYRIDEIKKITGEEVKDKA